MNLTGKVALVTGGSRNLGRDIARALASRGVRVAIGYHTSATEAEEVTAELEAEYGGHHRAIAGDLSTGAGADRLVTGTLDWAGTVDILVNNAGPFSKTPFLELDEADWDRVWNTNVTAIYRCTRRAAPVMRERGWGRIVNLSAVSAYVRNRSIYGLAKASVEVLTEELALELGPEITVNAVAPGQIRESLAEMAGVDPEWADDVTSRTPLGRLVGRAEVAELVALLCTPTFDAITGVTIPIDGGLRLPRF